MTKQRPIWDYIDFLSSDCWIWTGAKTTSGYGARSQGGVHRGAHVIVYEMLVSLIPPGLELDHLCRNRACVNPAHLEPVTHAENLRRSPLWKGNRTNPDTACRVTVNLPESVYNNAWPEPGSLA